MKYFDAINYSIALNPKVGSSSISIAVLETFHPDLYGKIVNGWYPEGITMETMQWHGLCPGSRKPTHPVVLMVREPVDRFLSGVAYMQLDLAEAVDSLVNGTDIQIRRRAMPIQRNIHFRPQVDFGWGDTHLFRFPEHINQFVSFVGLNGFPVRNTTPNPKPTPSAQQLESIRQAYAADIDLYDEVTVPGVVRAFPMRPIPEFPGMPSLEDDE